MSVFELWLPILLGGLAVHICSTLAWVVLPHHKPEWRKLDAEDEFIDWIDRNGVPVGQYVFPFSMDPEVSPEKFKQQAARCRGMLVMWPHVPNMGVNIGLTLAQFMAATFVIGYLTSLGVARDASFLEVFQFVFTAGVLTHVFCGISNVIWFRRKIAMDLLDGLVYALVTGLIFAALWGWSVGAPATT